MKNKLLLFLLAFNVALFTSNQASAYYSPSTGRWLSRDPNGEPGFETLRSASTVPKAGQVASTASLPPSRLFARDSIETAKSPNSYAFVRNDTQNAFDVLGLEGRNPPRPDDVPECYTCQPLPPSDPVCDRYGERTYLGASLRCFCKTPWLKDPWSQYVRACLACMDAKGVPVDEAHHACYDVADKTYTRPNGSLALAWCSCRK